VPIRTGAETLGVLALAWTDPVQLDDEEHVDLAVELASRAAAGLVNAALFDTQRDVALNLKATVLPAVLPRPSGLEIAARYLPSGGDVGGDWYDALVLSDGRVALTVGDVSGHGISAGATMGQLRNAVRAYLFDGHAPAAVLGRLNGLMELTSSEHVASVVIAVVDPEHGDVEWSCAGHPPALVVDRDGARAVSPPRGPVLGATKHVEYPQGRLELPEGGALLLYTDGLVERRDELIDVSIDRLAGQLGAALTASADDLCDRALEVTAARPRDDDVCVLVVRRD
jgi:serine phosphatase RsbU (regulator of sigma subunit)